MHVSKTYILKVIVPLSKKALKAKAVITCLLAASWGFQLCSQERERMLSKCVEQYVLSALILYDFLGPSHVLF
jgi:hypothetical protein